VTALKCKDARQTSLQEQKLRITAIYDKEIDKLSMHMNSPHSYPELLVLGGNYAHSLETLLQNRGLFDNVNGIMKSH